MISFFMQGDPSLSQSLLPPFPPSPSFFSGAVLLTKDVTMTGIDLHFLDILHFCHLLRRGAIIERQRKFVESIRTQGRKALIPRFRISHLLDITVFEKKQAYKTA